MNESRRIAPSPRRSRSACALPACADDALKLTIGQRGNWDTAITQLGTKAGIFKKHGIELEMIYTSGSGETLQPVISGAVDAGVAVGTLGAIAAFAKGAPVRIIAAEATGAADYWYAKTSSPIKNLKDLTDKNTIAYSTNGLVDPLDRARLHRRVRLEGQADDDRQSVARR